MKKKPLQERFFAQFPNTAGIVVLRDEEMVWEEYGNGCSASSRLHLYSVTKSVVCALVGIALEKGLLQSVDQPLHQFFPDQLPPDNPLTIRRLLTMTADYHFSVEPYEQYFASKDRVRFSLRCLRAGEPEGGFRYAPLVGPDILTGILTQVTGQSALDFARENLFAPLGIAVKGLLYLSAREELLAFYQSDTISGWAADENGTNSAGWGLTLSTRELARIGQLYLNRGVWKERRILPEDWVVQSSSVHSRWAQGDLGYGYLWWVIDPKERAFAAIGDAGTTLYVNEAKGLVVATTARFVPNAPDRIGFIRQVLEPLLE